MWLIIRRWVAAHMCVLSHFRTCDVRAEVRAGKCLEVCVRCRCVWANFDLRCAIALFLSICHFQKKKNQTFYLFASFLLFCLKELVKLI